MESSTVNQVVLKPTGCSVPVATANSCRSDPEMSPPLTYGRPNQVSTVMLYDVSIVCLWIEGKERLCLAQISNTLLKDYSYNEIHNRRVALGITCVQCTPVQLEILRRAGAMPVSSRRCGMITKREAERLVKSFLEDIHPPKLPEDFIFDVIHHCGWGCKGDFFPSRYNSSRAKCVKCKYCNMFFSANKFIFHYHRMSDSKYSHPDAANFNSWRRHLVLDLSGSNDKKRNEELLHAWEDVKAMFNGGSRKRMVPSSFKSSNSTNYSKTQKLTSSSNERRIMSSVKHTYEQRSLATEPTVPPFIKFQQSRCPTAPNSGIFPYFPSKALNFGSRLLPDSRRFDFPCLFPRNMAYPSYEMIWAQHLGLNQLPRNSETFSAMPRFQNLFKNNQAHENDAIQLSPKSEKPDDNSLDEIEETPQVKTAKKAIFRPYALDDMHTGNVTSVSKLDGEEESINVNFNENEHLRENEQERKNNNSIECQNDSKSHTDETNEVLLDIKDDITD